MNQMVEPVPAFMSDGGEMGALMRAHDWSATPLGPPDTWPETLKTMVSVVLNSALLGTVLWGPELRLLYNDAYAPALAERHPKALGRPIAEVWGPVWDQIAPSFLDVMATGKAIFEKRLPLTMARNGQDELTFWNYSVTPIRDKDYQIVGLLNQAIEITGEVRAEQERIRAETALQNLNASLEQQIASRTQERNQLWQLSRDPFLVSDAQGIWLSASPIWTKILGWTQAELLGRTSAWMEHPDDHDKTRAEIVDLVRGETTINFINRFRDRQGSYHWFAWTAVAEGKRLYCVARDITAERMQAAALAEEAAARERTWQFTPDLFSVIDLQSSVFERVNPAWTAILGWSREEIEGTTYQKFVHPDDLNASTDAFKEVQGGNPVLRFENRYRTKDGGWRWLSWVAFPEGDKLYSSARDVTYIHEQATQLEVATKEREQTWRLSQELLVVALPDGTIESINPAWTELLGWERSDIIGKPFNGFTHPDDLAATLVAFAGIFTEPLVIPYEYRFRHKDGSYRWFGWTGTFDNGKVYAAGRNLTVEKDQAEALRQSQKMEAVGQLTGGLAHDFNNLLAVIIGSLELLEMRIAKGRLNDIERFISASQTAAKRATSLTHRLLAFSRRQTLDPQQTDLNALVAGMADMVRRTVGPEILVETVGAPDLWMTLVDPSQLENALLNLCINARDAMPEGGRIMIDAENKVLDQRAARARDMATGDYVVLSVSDTGAGMPPEVVSRVFEPFYTTKPIGQGTGLGLSMVYGFARQSEGQVRIHSEVGKGTTINIYLPRSLGIIEEEIKQTDAAPERAKDGQTVLVVDDEQSVRMLIVDVLEDLGYIAIEANDGIAALKVLQSDLHIDLLVTDVGMPGMNGRQLADAGRALRPELRVLYITGYAEAAVVSHGHLEPGMAIITKPFGLDAIANRIKALIDLSATT